MFLIRFLVSTLLLSTPEFHLQWINKSLPRLKCWSEKFDCFLENPHLEFDATTHFIKVETGAMKRLVKLCKWLKSPDAKLSLLQSRAVTRWKHLAHYEEEEEHNKEAGIKEKKTFGLCTKGTFCSFWHHQHFDCQVVAHTCDYVCQVLQVVIIMKLIIISSNNNNKLWQHLSTLRETLEHIFRKIFEKSEIENL